MIQKCCICGEKTKKYYEIAFEDLIGANENPYYQNIGLCKKCGFVFTMNPFSSSQLSNRYKYMSKFEYDSKDYILDYNYATQATRQRNFISENIDLASINSMLEIGAASGYNLSIYKDCIDDLYGIEPSYNNCVLAKQNYNVKMFNGMFDDYYKKEKNKKYDLVFMSMVLEHIVNPMKFMKKVCSISSEYIFIEVPTLDYRSVEEPMGIFCEEHVNLFTLDSLNSLMRRNGFHLINVEIIQGYKRYLPAGYPAISTIWCHDSNDINTMQFNICSSEELLKRYIKYSNYAMKKVKNRIDQIPNDLKLGVWGIGHHSAMLLANTSLKDKNIVKVYDSDVRKYSYKYNGICIEKFDINDVINCKIDAILITSYTAQIAIYNYIRSLDVKCDIITLYDL